MNPIVHSNAELAAYGKTLQKYRKEKKDDKGEYFIYDLREYLRDLGIFNKYDQLRQSRIKDYENFMLRHDQYSNYVARVAYAKKQDMGQLDETPVEPINF
jgi:hypothetical protein